mmetsp:Transcript_31132/g.45536  ORF Transcript_31132/g.45536 Transcript_31132/m.45536 type:complete len:87 (-) Transcript_31132:10-270(-)
MTSMTTMPTTTTLEDTRYASLCIYLIYVSLKVAVRSATPTESRRCIFSQISLGVSLSRNFSSFNASFSTSLSHIFNLIVCCLYKCR